MRRAIILAMIIILFSPPAYGQAEEVVVGQNEVVTEEQGEQVTEEQGEEVKAEPILVLREGKQSRRNFVAIEAHLMPPDVPEEVIPEEAILEISVEARMYAEKPKISDVILKGPKLGRLHYKTRETVFARIDESGPYEVTKTDGIIALGKRKRTKIPKGTLTTEMFQLKIPRKKIVSGKRYQLTIELESKTRGGGKPLKFKFNIENLAELLEELRPSSSGG